MVEYVLPKASDRKEEDEDFKERLSFFEAVAFRINDAARSVIFRNNKAWISDVASKLNIPMRRFVPILMKLQRWGLVDLSRADLTGSLDFDKVYDSTIKLIGSLGELATYNFIVIAG